VSGARRGGTTLVETLIALLLGLWVTQAAFGMIARLRKLHLEVIDQVDVLGSQRFVGTLLRSEVGVGVADIDWGVAADSMWLRAFRGTGIVCADPESEADAVTVSWTGYRLPDPDKDSVLLIDPLGGMFATALETVSAASGTCDGVTLEHGLVLRLSEAVARAAVVARVFERGTYSLSGAALRYRRGAGGRQPITPEVWAEGTGWITDQGRVGVALIAVRRGVPWRRALAGAGR
jgi:hypothetical protein